MADRKIFISDSPKNPNLKVSPFDLSFVNNLTTKFGKVCVPYVQYCPPKTRLKINPTFAFRLAPLVFPIQTNVRAHLKFYKVPLRILWENWEDFQSMVGTNGLPTNGGGSQHVVPYIKRETGWNAKGSLSEQIGCSNLRLVNVSQRLDFPLQRKVISTSFNGLLSALPQFQCFDVDFGNRYGVELTTSETAGDMTFLFHYLSLNSARPSMSSGTISLQVLTKNNDGTLLERGNPVVFTPVNSVSLLNSATDPSFFIPSSAANTVTVDGHTVYDRYMRFKIPEGHFFYTMVNNYVAAGLKVVFRITADSTWRPYLFPDVSQESISVQTQQVVKPNKYVEESGDITSLESVNNVVARLGVVSPFNVSVFSQGEEVDTKFDSISGADPVEPVCALPFRALEFIHNYFMRNPRIDPFIKDGNPSYNKFLTNVSDGADSTTPVDSWYALYEDDYFTTCVKEPQFGNAPLVGVTVNDLSDKGILRFADETDPANNYTVEVPLDENGAALPVTMYKEIADKPNIQRLNELISFGISINDLRNVSTFQRMLERMQRTGHRYANVVYEFFGTNPPVGDHYPRYLGGCTRNITVDEIMNTALSENAKLGEPAGVASFAGKGKTIKCFCTEASYVIGILYFTVTPTYSQYLPKHLLYKTPLDFYLNPEFAFMGPQPVYKKEITPNQISSEQLNDLFGYNRPYAELASRVDEVHGEFKTSMANYLLQRMFAGPAELNSSFIEIRPEHLLNIFSVTENTDKIWGQVYFKVKASLPFPRSYQPRSI